MAKCKTEAVYVTLVMTPHRMALLSQPYKAPNHSVFQHSPSLAYCLQGQRKAVLWGKNSLKMTTELIRDLGCMKGGPQLYRKCISVEHFLSQGCQIIELHLHPEPSNTRAYTSHFCVLRGAKWLENLQLNSWAYAAERPAEHCLMSSLSTQCWDLTWAALTNLVLVTRLP